MNPRIDVAIDPITIYYYHYNCFKTLSIFLHFSFYFCLISFHRHILSLSIADLMLILTAVPFVSVVYTVESWPWGTRMCMMSEFMKDFSTGVSVFTLVAMSFDRFVAIVNPLRRFQGSGKLTFWIYSFSIGKINFFVRNILTTSKKEQPNANMT